MSAVRAKYTNIVGVDTHARTTGFTAPHGTTFQHVLARLDAEAFDQALSAWMQTQVDARIIAIDGKELRGAKTVARTACTAWQRWTTRPAPSSDRST